jgi:glycosyltransferase involved in cell wall biosynthesis
LVDDAEGLKDSIIRLSNDENLGKKLSSSGRKLVIEKYNWEKYQAIYGKIIDSLDRR